MVTLSNQFGGPYFTRGGQGKLFHDPKPVNEHRYQRGYTPERMRDVQGSMLDIGSSGEGHFAGPAGVHRVFQTIARSTTPTHEFNETPATTAARLTHMTAPVDQSDLWPLHIETGHKAGDVAPDGGRGGRQSAPAAASYARGGHWDRGVIRIGADTHFTEERAGQSLMHELGHYKSAKVEGNDYSNAPAEAGREEARADDNMVERWRPDPRDVRRGGGQLKTPTYESPTAFHGIGGQKAWGPYLTARRTLSKENRAAIRSVGHTPRAHRDIYAETEFETPTGERHTMANPDTRVLSRYHQPAEWNVQAPLFNPNQFNA